MLDPIAVLFTILALLSPAAPANAEAPPAPFGPLPTEGQLHWHRTEMMGLVCLGLNTFTDQEWGYGDVPAERFAPTALDTDQWAEAAKAAGIRTLILVAKHHDGFCLWPTDTTDYSVKASPWNSGEGDVLEDLARSCKRSGLGLGIYISPWDRHHEGYGSEAYVRCFHDQWREALTRYGPVVELWFDGANGGDGYYGGARERRRIDSKTYYRLGEVLKLARKHQNPFVAFGAGEAGSVRWVGNEAGTAGETNWCRFPDTGFADPVDRSLRATGAVDGAVWRPAEADTPFRRRGWYWHPDEDPKSLARLVDIYFESVGRNATLNLGLAPDRTGRLEAEDVIRLKELGDYLRAMYRKDYAAGRPVTVDSRRGTEMRFAPANLVDGNDHTYWASADGVTACTLEIDLGAPKTFNVIALGEYLPLGQRVEAFAVDAFTGGAWRTVGGGTTIGHKRLLRLPGTRASRVRVRIEKALACPVIRRVGLHVAEPLAAGRARTVK